MIAPSTVTPARALLSILASAKRQEVPSDALADNAMADFLTELKTLDHTHNRGKRLTQDQLAEQIFRRHPTFKDERAAVPYLRYQLRVALEELTLLDREMRDQSGGSITFPVLSRYSQILIDYLLDLREILIFLQRKVPGWTFFDGGKNSDVNSWQVYILARGLAYQSTYTGSGSPFDHKPAQIASLFVLRQAMELRFERLIAVYPTDRKGRSPKLKHSFHQDFIAANTQFFRADGFQIKELRHLYDWCSEIVHQAYQPYAWQISMALRRAGDLLHSRPMSTGGRAWSLFNSVIIDNVEGMQSAYERHFLRTYGHGEWQFTRARPEALVPNWRPEMANTSDTYLPALNRRGLFNRIKLSIWQIIRKSH